MADDEFDQVSQILFDGVDSLSNIGSPGTLIPMTDNTRTVLCSEDFNNVIVVATQFGHSLCLVFALNGCTEIFLNDETEDQDFVENCLQWLARGYDTEFESINDTDSMDNVARAGRWADIAGRHIVFNVPSKSVLHLDSIQLDRVLQYWDAVVLAHHELRGTEPTHRERIVCDEQPSLGYMHSGYPIVTHMDVSDPFSEGYILNSNKLEKNGAWDLFHEIGHNMQRDYWTYDGADEVTVNIFTLHAMDTICHHQVWIHPWLKDQIKNTWKYIKKGSNFDDWKEDPGVALFIYAQLARGFGWDSHKAVFRQYEQDQPNLDSDQEKIDYWIETFSRQVEYNLVPLFKCWDFPISQSTIDSLSDLKIPEISNEFIDMAPERYQL
ncbi:unnamed protein product [Rotaria sp. Silwood1]|nr:unnamed protein product [Rotaria sp. Silwood1]